MRKRKAVRMGQNMNRFEIRIEVLFPDGHVVGIQRLSDLSKYLIVREGRIFSLGRKPGDGVRELKPTPSSGGYPTVSIYENGKKTNIGLHHLISAAFLPRKPRHKNMRLHGDDDKSNNAAGNIYYGDAQDNANDRERNGKTAKGEIIWSAKLTPRTVREIRTSSQPTKVLATMYNVSPCTILRARRGSSWRHIKG